MPKGVERHSSFYAFGYAQSAMPSQLYTSLHGTPYWPSAAKSANENELGAMLEQFDCGLLLLKDLSRCLDD